MFGTDEELFDRISEKTGLSVTTCEELLRSGWQYFESVNHPPVWKSPGWSRLRDRKLNDVPLGDPTKIVFMAGETLVVRNYGQVVKGDG